MLSVDQKIQKTIGIVREAFGSSQFIALHEPRFVGREKQLLADCIDSTFVSYLGRYVTDLEKMICELTGSKFCLTVVNGTAALHMAMLGAGVEPDTEVITQPLTFVATANAIKYCGAHLVFVDVERESLGMSPDSLKAFFQTETTMLNGRCVNKRTGRVISACVPVHIFGHPLRIEEIVNICNDYGVSVVEDSAESVGAYRNNRHTGTFGKIGIFSFNGNKIVTCGGGGAIVTDDENCYKKMKHLSTTAKVAHPWLYLHDEVGYNYRLPNLNAAVLVAQFEQLSFFLESKRKLAQFYKQEFAKIGIQFLQEPSNTKSNYWLNALVLESKEERELFLQQLNAAGVMCRPSWELMHKLEPFKKSQVFSAAVSQEMSEKIINIPSSVRL